ncbi:MAG: hypothetical protein C0507_23295 [Cyanobacteria bacterium PR.3.49]|jgi:hypothetical protein|nr:hypothetical protein [Cyanobacteria bacterium PR.3.49]
MPNTAQLLAFTESPYRESGKSEKAQEGANGARKEIIFNAPQARPHLVQVASPVQQRDSRKAPLVVRVNQVLRTSLIAFCGLAIVGYGLDVARTNDVTRLQEQARRLSEQNSELSAQLLRAISFEGIQDSVVGRHGLQVPEHVLIVPEKAAPKLSAFKPNQHSLPLMSGY